MLMETAILSLAKETDALLDADVQAGLELALRSMKARAAGKPEPALLSGLAHTVYEGVMLACNAFSGGLVEVDGKLTNALRIATLNELIACLKRLRASCQLWTRKGGRRGYVRFLLETLRLD